MLHRVTETIFVFDLDDTLYSEKAYEESGIKAVWCHFSELIPEISSTSFLDKLLFNSQDWIQQILEATGGNELISKETLINFYRTHLPNIKLYDDALQLLKFLKLNNSKMALITDGRSITQRQKIKALNITEFFNTICISEEMGSEKPSMTSYELIQNVFPGMKYIYIGDNVNKDFLAPNNMGWVTYGVRDRGCNIHVFDVSHFDKKYQPKFWLDTLFELKSKVI